MSKPLETRFWAKVDTTTTPDGCWLWIGSRRHSYGEIINNGKKLYAHRVSYMLAFGTIPTGAHVCHRCDTPLCINPAHLFAGTQTDNMRDARDKGRMRGLFTSERMSGPRGTHCKRGHEFNAENTIRRTTADGRESRCCKVCSDASKRRYAQRKRAA